MGYTMAKCHGCGKVISRSEGCKGRVVICEKCRVDPKKLKAARRAMIEHLAVEHGYKG
jgi:Zn finger protein HypA/HybF involved in hydrogenase expression